LRVIVHPTQEWHGRYTVAGDMHVVEKTQGACAKVSAKRYGQGGYSERRFGTRHSLQDAMYQKLSTEKLCTE